jgi:hypothetical protein
VRHLCAYKLGWVRLKGGDAFGAQQAALRELPGTPDDRRGSPEVHWLAIDYGASVEALAGAAVESAVLSEILNRAAARARDRGDCRGVLEADGLLLARLPDAPDAALALARAAACAEHEGLVAEAQRLTALLASRYGPGSAWQKALVAMAGREGRDDKEVAELLRPSRLALPPRPGPAEIDEWTRGRLGVWARSCEALVGNLPERADVERTADGTLQVRVGRDKAEPWVRCAQASAVRWFPAWVPPFRARLLDVPHPQADPPDPPSPAPGRAPSRRPSPGPGKHPVGFVE